MPAMAKIQRASFMSPPWRNGTAARWAGSLDCHSMRRRIVLGREPDLQENRTMNEHRVVIAGAGYAGVSCALRLARRVPPNTSVTLISATDRFVERIRLHQRATGQNVGDWSLPSLIRGCGIELRVGVLEQLDLDNRMFRIGGERIAFETVVLALGSHVDVASVRGVS